MIVVSMTPTLIGLGALFAIAGFLVIAVGVTAAGVRAWQRRHPDPAWRERVPVQKFKGYDQDKAVTAKHRALEIEASKRKLAAMRSEPRGVERGPRPATVVRIEKARRAR